VCNLRVKTALGAIYSFRSSPEGVPAYDWVVTNFQLSPKAATGGGQLRVASCRSTERPRVACNGQGRTVEMAGPSELLGPAYANRAPDEFIHCNAIAGHTELGAPTRWDPLQGRESRSTPTGAAYGSRSFNNPCSC